MQFRTIGIVLIIVLVTQCMYEVSARSKGGKRRSSSTRRTSSTRRPSTTHRHETHKKDPTSAPFVHTKHTNSVNNTMGDAKPIRRRIHKQNHAAVTNTTKVHSSPDHFNSTGVGRPSLNTLPSNHQQVVHLPANVPGGAMGNVPYITSNQAVSSDTKYGDEIAGAVLNITKYAAKEFRNSMRKKTNSQRRGDGTDNQGGQTKIIIINNKPSGVTANNAGGAQPEPPYTAPLAPFAPPPAELVPGTIAAVGATTNDAGVPPGGGIVCVPVSMPEPDPNDRTKTIKVEKMACYPAPPPETAASSVVNGSTNTPGAASTAFVPGINAPPAVAAADPNAAPPAAGIICVPVRVSEPDPKDKTKTIEVENIACYPAPPPEVIHAPVVNGAGVASISTNTLGAASPAMVPGTYAAPPAAPAVAVPVGK